MPSNTDIETKPRKESKLLNFVADLAEKVMPRKEWEGFAEREISQVLNFLKGLGRGASAQYPYAKVLGLEKKPTPEEKQKEKEVFLDTILYPLKQIARPVEAIRGGIGAKIEKKPILPAMAKGFLKPEEVEPISRKIPFQEFEQKGIAGLIPRAVAEAIEQYALYTLTYGGVIAKAGRASEMRQIESKIPLFEKAGVKFPKGMNVGDKAKVILGVAQRDPKVGDVLAKSFAIPTEVYAGLPVKFKVGDLAKIGKETVKVLKVTGTKAVLGVKGKEITRNLSVLKPIEPKQPTLPKTIGGLVKQSGLIDPNKARRVGWGNEDIKELKQFMKVGGQAPDVLADELMGAGELSGEETPSDILLEALKEKQPTLSEVERKIPRAKITKGVKSKIKELETIKGKPNAWLRKTEAIKKTTGEEKEEWITALEMELPSARVSGKVEPDPTTYQLAKAHNIAKQKALITPEGKTRPGYRRLALGMTGKKSMKDMTGKEADEFINALEKISEPVYKKGELIPPSIPQTTALVKPEFFTQRFKKPTPAKLLTSQTRYAELLGIKKIVAPMEMGKQELDLEYAKGAQQIDVIDKKLKSLKGVSSKEMARMLNVSEEAPASLSIKEKEVFDYYRSLTRDILARENEVRKTVGLEPIHYRQAYLKHVADRMSQEIIAGKYPLPEGLKYWSRQTISKKVYNPMEMKRHLRDDLLEKFSSNLPYVMKSMLWSGLKEIHLSIPKHILNKELGVLTKDPKVYKNLSPQEQRLYDAQTTMPALTKKWLLDYVNIVLGGKQTALDETVNLWVTDTPIKTVINNILKPFGKLVGQKPFTSMLSRFSRLPIYGTLGGVNPRQLLRNKMQTLQSMALYGVKNTIKGYLPTSSYPALEKLKTDSLFKKSYSGFEDMPLGAMKKAEKLGLAPYQWSAVSNVSQAMNVSYHWTADNIQNPKKSHLGWADSQRTYKEDKDFFYPSEKERLLKEMEYGAHTSQYQYISLGMPEVFRYKALAPFTRLQSWWMNHWLVFHREASTRFVKGHTGYDPDLKLTIGDRINYIKYLFIGGAILTNLGYYKSYLLGTAPSGLPPTAQLMMGLYDYYTNPGDSSWEKRKRGQAEYKIKEALKVHLPGYLSIKDSIAFFSGKKDWTEYLFYKKRGKAKREFKFYDSKGGSGGTGKKGKFKFY